MKRLLLPITIWGLAFMGFIVAVTLYFAGKQVRTAAFGFASVFGLLPGMFQAVLITFTVCICVVMVAGTGYALTWVWEKIVLVRERMYNFGVLMVEEGAAVAHRDRQYLLSRNPRSAHTNRVEVNEVESDIAGLLPQQMPTAPAFSSIESMIKPDGLFPLGWGTNGPVLGEIDDLLSTGVLGLPKYGKSTALRYLVAVSIKAGADILGWDPHATIAEEFGQLVNIVDDRADIMRSARQIKPILQKRLADRKQKRPMRSLVILIDELPALIAGLSSDEEKIVTDAIESVILEGRKVRMYMIICGQGLPARLFKDTTSRNSLSSKYVFYVEREQAKQAGVGKEEYETYVAPLEPMIGKGIAYFRCPSRAKRELVAIPYTTESDLQRLIVGTTVVDSNIVSPFTDTENAPGEPRGAFESEQVNGERVGGTYLEDGEQFTGDDEQTQAIHEDTLSIMRVIAELQAEGKKVTRNAVATRLGWNWHRWKEIEAVMKFIEV